jgi:hypothetical protein
MINYEPSPTGQRFHDSRKFIKIIQGPVGGGKSTAALMELLKRAVEQEPFKGVRRTKMGILRNTTAQLKATIKPLIDTWFGTLTNNTMGQWRLTDNVFEARFKLPDGTTVHSEFMLLAADTPEDVRRLLSLELSAAWVEEAREIDPDVFSGLQGRTARYPSRAAGGVTYPGVICSMNPPSLGGFWHGMVANPPSNTEVFLQPPALLDDGSINPEAENLEHLDPDYYDNLIAGKTEDWINVYLKNQFGAGNMGMPVFRSSFKRSFHVSSKGLMAVPESVNPLIVGMDNGLQGAATVMQRNMLGRVNVLAEAYVPEDTTMGAESFLDKILIPKLDRLFPRFSREAFVFVMDPACWQRSQVDEKTIAMAVTQRGFTAVKAMTNDPVRRVDAVEGLLALQIDGGPGFLIDEEECPHLVEALDWGYRYKKGPGGVTTTTFEKNHYSHIAESLQYGALHYNMSGSYRGPVRRPEARPIVRRGFLYV